MYVQKHFSSLAVQMKRIGLVISLIFIGVGCHCLRLEVCPFLLAISFESLQLQGVTTTDDLVADVSPESNPLTDRTPVERMNES